MNRHDAPQRIKAAYVATVRGGHRALTAAGLASAEPPGREHRLRHWAHSLTRVHDSLALAELDVPWWTYSAIDDVDAWLAARARSVRVFEYGSGASTLWLSRRADEVHSVEHHAGFGRSVAPAMAAQGNVDLRIVEPTASAHPVVASAKAGHAGLDFAAYVAAIDDVPGTFDLVVIDGRARAACLQRAVGRLAPDGLVVFDNSARRRYRRAIAASGLDERRRRGLTPTLPYPEQTSLLTPPLTTRRS